MPVGETKQLGLVVGAGLVIGIIAVILIFTLPPLFSGDLTVESYEAAIYEDGTLSEHYTYDVAGSGEYRML